VAGTVKDALGRAVSGATVSLQARNGHTVASTKANSEGQFSFSGRAPGVYAVLAHKAGFKPATAIVVVPVGHPPKPVMVSMASEQALSLNLAATRLHRSRNQLSRGTGSNLYHFSAESIARLPQGGNTPLNQVLLQAPGVVQDSFGQVHIRGDHADLQYRIDGIMLPEGTGGFGQVLNPRFASSVNLLDGALSSEYSYRTAGVVEIHPKQGCDNQGGDIEMYGGQRATMQPNFELGGCKGNFSYYVTGFYLQDDLGLESATPGPVAIHDHTQQGQGFGYFSYLLNATTKVSLITGLSVSDYQIPAYPNQTPVYNLTGVAPGSYPSQDIAESQLQQVYFSILALQGAAGPKLDYKLAFFDRYSTLHFMPDPIGDLIFNGVASDVLNTDFAYGFQEDTTYRLNDRHTLGAGAYFAGENVELDNTSSVFPGSPGHQTGETPFTIVDNLNKLTWLGGVYIQDEWRLADKLTLTYGLRWDIQDAFVEANQFEPRLALVYKLARGMTLHAGYSRYFTPPPLENISPKTIAKFAGTTNAATAAGNENVSPETDDYFDAGMVQTLFENLSLGVDSYFKLANNLLDEGQFGQALVYAPFNYKHGRVYGVELTGNYTADNFSVYGNFAYSIAQGTEVESGQFNFTPQELAYIANHYVYLDHEQYYTASAGVSYRWKGFLFSVDGIYGSGLREGFANTGHLPGYIQVNLGIIRSIDLPMLGKVEGRVSILNLFDKVYQIRNGTGIGVFAPQYGPRRAAYFGLRVPLPFVASAGSAKQAAN
jgi:outer membrane receptor protein involved in Fe transport